MLPTEIRDPLADDVLDRFLRYVQVHTTSDERSKSIPSTPGQRDLLRLLAREAHECGLDVRLEEERGFCLATLRARERRDAEPFALYAHVDTSPEQPGDEVRPVCHLGWDGSPIRFDDDPALELSAADSPELADLVGGTIITGSGRTLLGADDKAGVAEILAALAALARSDLPHGEIVACFTTDEEIGRGTEGLDLSLLPRYGYTMDGGRPGELEDECFDAWRIDIAVTGVGVHPGTAKGRMVHAGMLLARLLAALPEAETPERTEGREGFYYLSESHGTVEHARAAVIVRDFEAAANQARIARVREIARDLARGHPGSRIEVESREQYRNMRDILREHPLVVERAEAAIRDAGVTPIRQPIRGGTDGSLLTQAGHPTPNIFAGGMLAHSRKEWIAHESLCRAAETIIHLAKRWS